MYHKRRHRIMKHTLISVFLIFQISCSTGQEKNKQMESKQQETKTYPYTNKLIHETSPYLLQHAHNPVNWYPWGEEAFEKARIENKLVLISIGYSSCHWCHVMEQESYENEEIASLMNEKYVCIKVDREERPDVDQIYMNAVQLLTGGGGWPLNCFALPDKSPVYGGTYFPPAQWKDLLEKLVLTWEKDPEKVKQYARQLKEGVISSEIVKMQKDPVDFMMTDLDEMVASWEKHFDKKEGGNDHALKFPMPSGYEFFLDYYYHSKNEAVLNHITLSLNKMASGGIYDQIGGGFARYSTDKYWKVPHFEKMLYDNAQLVSLYSRAYQLTKDEKFRDVVEHTLDFIEREMTSPEGGFYSSFDADSEGEEGKFYVWTKKEIESVLGKNAKVIEDYYNVTDEGNWEQTNILYVTETKEVFCKKHELDPVKFDEILRNSREKLFIEREKRVKPDRDEKILTSWNALMLKAYADAYRVFGIEKYLLAANRNADFLLNQMDEDGRLNRNYKDGRSGINAFLDDYSLTIRAFIGLYQSGFDEKRLLTAKKLSDYVLQHFYDDQSGMFFYTSNVKNDLIARKMEISDNVIPASNSIMADDLFLLAVYYDKPEYRKTARQMLVNVKEQTLSNGAYYSNWARQMLSFIYKPSEVVIAGRSAKTLQRELNTYFLPGIILAGGDKPGSLPLMRDRFIDGENLIYVCRNNVCKLPVKTVNEALREIAEQ